jgi:FkbM family methyltransferase
MNANSPGKQFLTQMVNAPGVSGILIPLARNRWLLPQALRLHLKAQLRVRQALVSAPLPDGAVVKLWHDSLSSDVSTRIYWDGFAGYESGTPHFFFDRCRNARVVLDIGANVGYYSILAALSNPDAEIIAFEPVPQLYDRLVRNVELNQLGSRIKAMKLAVSDRCDEIPLYVPNNGVLCESSILAGFRPDSMQLRAEATTVDSFLQSHGVGSVDLIKIDVEGAEHLVFEGMWKTLERMQSDIICEVLPGRFRAETEDRLASLGYRFAWICDGKLVRMQRIRPDTHYLNPNFYFSTHLYQ